MSLLPLVRRSPRTGPAQRETWRQQFRQSGLSRQAFARKHGLKLSTLHRWLAQAKSSLAPAAHPVVFQEVRPPTGLPIAGSSWALEILTPSGLLLRLR